MSESQRGRHYNSKRKNYFRQIDSQRRKFEEYLEAGLQGFICTCNFNEDQCKREAYNILNEYSETEEVEKPTLSEDKVEEEDIEERLNKEVSELKAQTSRGSKLMKFQNVKTGAKNCLFIRTTVPDPVQLVVRLLEDIEATKKHKSRHLLRMLPIEITCKATVNSMEEAFKPLVKKHFSSEGKTFSVIYRARCNSSASRGEVIELLAGLIKNAHPLNRADLDNPQLAVLVEIIKGICCIGVVPRYNELKRYNLHELVNPSAAKGEAAAVLAGGGGDAGEGGEPLTTPDNGHEAEGVDGAVGTATADHSKEVVSGGAGDKGDGPKAEGLDGAVGTATADHDKEVVGGGAGDKGDGPKADGVDGAVGMATANHDKEVVSGGAGDKGDATEEDACKAEETKDKDEPKSGLDKNAPGEDRE